MKDYNRNPERLGRVIIKFSEKKEKCKGIRDILCWFYMYNRDDHNIIVNIDIDCESDLEKNIDNNKDLYFYIKIIV